MTPARATLIFLFLSFVYQQVVNSTLTLPSDYSYSQTMVPSQGLFFSQTEPSTDMLNASSWGQITESSQSYSSSEFPDNGSSHSGEAEEYIITSGQTTPRGTRLGRPTWAVALGSAPARGHAMTRVDSNRSNGSMLSHASHLSGNGSAAFRNGPQNAGSLNGVDTCLLADATAPQFWQDYNLSPSLDMDNAAFLSAETNNLHVVPSQTQFGPDMADHTSPSSWVLGSISRTSSPTTVDEAWLQAHGPLSPPNSSPEIPCQSPSYVPQSPSMLIVRRYTHQPHSIDFTGQLKAEDLNAGLLPDGMTLPPSMGNRRDGETARNHDLYKTAQTGPDGLFHCPWEGDPSCNHKPEKLKCNYE